MTWLTLPEHRCSCGHLLFKGTLVLGVLEIKCHSCKHINQIGTLLITPTPGQYAFFGEVDEHNSEAFRVQILDCTPSVAEILGYTRDELLKLNTSIDPFLSSGGFDELWREVVRHNPIPLSTETIHRKKSGELLRSRVRVQWVRIRGRLHGIYVFEAMDGRRVSLEGDDNDQKENGENGMCQLVLEIDAKGICTYASEELAYLLGYKSTDIVLRPVVNLAPRDERVAFSHRYSEMVRQREPFRLQNIILERKDGKKLVCEAFAATRQQGDLRFEGYTLSLWPKDSQVTVLSE